jgi:transcriptional regulator with XRE-family HTH domain
VRLAAWRREQGWTQQQLADALGITQGTVSQIERVGSTQTPMTETVIAVYRVTRGAVTPNDFYELPSLDQLELAINEPAPAPLFEAVQQ